MYPHRRFVLYPRSKIQVQENLTFIQRNRTVPVRQRIKQRNEKEKIEFVSKNKGFLNSIIFLS